MLAKKHPLTPNATKWIKFSSKYTSYLASAANGLGITLANYFSDKNDLKNALLSQVVTSSVGTGLTIFSGVTKSLEETKRHTNDKQRGYGQAFLNISGRFLTFALQSYSLATHVDAYMAYQDGDDEPAIDPTLSLVLNVVLLSLQLSIIGLDMMPAGCTREKDCDQEGGLYNTVCHYASYLKCW